MNEMSIKKLQQGLSSYKLDALLITKQANISYLSGFTGEGQLLITRKKKILIIDARFSEQAAKQAGDFRLYDYRNLQQSCLEKQLLRLTRHWKLKIIGFEGLALSCNAYHRLKKTLFPIKLVMTTNIVERLRAIKSAREVRLLKKASALAIKTYHYAQQIVQPGKKETAIANELQYFMRKQGAEDSSFDIIVASGKRNSMPHAPTSGKKLRANETVLLDLGCRAGGYNSDLTRMVFLGKIGGKIKRIYQTVLRAQHLAIKAIRAGVRIREIDKIARQYIDQEGFGAFFVHALGHGIGREVHEYPSISPYLNDYVQTGMVFTVEPAIYIPGLGGVRVEDMVLVTKTGCEILTNE